MKKYLDLIRGKLSKEASQPKKIKSDEARLFDRLKRLGSEIVVMAM